MKRLALFLVAVTSASSLFGVLPAYDGINYPVGQALPGQVSPDGLTWSAAGPAGTDVSIAAGNLTVPGLAGPTGNMFQYGVAFGPSARFNLGTAITSGSIYYSFALQVTDLGTLGTSGGFNVAFNNSQGNQTGTPTVVGSMLMVRADAATPNTFNLGVRKVASGTPTWHTPAYGPGQTIFVVGSYTFETGSTTDDVSQMWLDPDPLSFGQASAPAPTLTHSGVGTDLAQIASLVFFRRGTTTGGNLTLQPAAMFSDEVRVGNTWADVTSLIPEPTTASLITLGLAAMACRRRRS